MPYERLKFMINLTFSELQNIYGLHYSYIYKLTCNVSGKIYVGKAINPIARWLRHIRDSYNVHCSGYENPIHRAIRKYGGDNFSIEILDWAESLKDINKKEKYYIDILNCRDNSIGYNIAPGGNGGDLLSSKSKEDYDNARENYKKAALLRESDPELKKRKSNTLKMLRATTCPIWNKGISPKPESIEKWKETMRKKKESGWVWPHRTTPSPASKKVLCIETGVIYINAKIACKEMGLDITKERSIRDYCNGKLKKAPFGYHWKWANNE